MKEQDKVMARDLIKTDVSNMTEGEFRATIIRILSGLRKRMEEFREALITEVKELRNNQSELSISQK